MSSQEAFLARVRRALHTESAPATGRAPLMSQDLQAVEAATALQARLATQRPALVAQVQRELTAVGGCVARVSSAAEATRYVTQLAEEKGATLIVRWASALLDTLEVEAALQQQRVAVHTTIPPETGDTLDTAALAGRRQELRELLARADLGLSGVDYVIAETGTLVLVALPGQMRGVSLLPPVHVAVARTAQVVATLAEALALIQAAAGPDLQQHLSSCVSFVTGPSRTADIELQLSIGVHGPKELHLVLLDEPTT